MQRHHCFFSFTNIFWCSGYFHIFLSEVVWSSLCTVYSEWKKLTAYLVGHLPTSSLTASFFFSVETEEMKNPKATGWLFFFIFFLFNNLPSSCTHLKNPTHLTYTDVSNGSLPQGDCHQQVRPAAGAQISPWPERRSQRRACLWSQTSPHLAARSGSWHNPAWGVGNWCQSQQPLGRSTEELPGWHFHCSAATESRRSPEQKQDSREKFTQSAVCQLFSLRVV